MSKVRKKIVFVRKFFFILLMTFFMVFLGFLGRIGYSVSNIKEIEFKPYNRLGYADVIVDCNLTYNPLLYPFYWMMNDGCLSGEFFLRYVPEGYYPGEFGGPIWGYKSSDRYDSYLNMLILWGFLPNFFMLFVINTGIELMDQKSIYIPYFLGIVGFYLGELFGLFLGVIVGIVCLVIFLKFRLNIFVNKIIDYLLERYD